MLHIQVDRYVLFDIYLFIRAHIFFVFCLAIVGIVVGGALLLIGVVVFILIVILRRNQNRKVKSEVQTNQISSSDRDIAVKEMNCSTLLSFVLMEFYTNFFVYVIKTTQMIRYVQSCKVF